MRLVFARETASSRKFASVSGSVESLKALHEPMNLLFVLCVYIEYHKETGTRKQALCDALFVFGVWLLLVIIRAHVPRIPAGVSSLPHVRRDKWSGSLFSDFISRHT